MWQHPTDSDLQPFVSTTARYGFATLPFGCSPSLFSLFSLSGSTAILIATSEKKVLSVWGASIGFPPRKTTAKKPTVPQHLQNIWIIPKHYRADRRTREVAPGLTRERNGNIPSRSILTKATTQNYCEEVETVSVLYPRSSMSLPSTATSVRRCPRRTLLVSVHCRAWRTISTKSLMRLTSIISLLLKKRYWSWLGRLTRPSFDWVVLRHN